MTCAPTRALLGEYLEADLALPVRAEVDDHLNQCADCRSELQELRSTVSLLRSLPTPEPPSRLAAAVMERIESGETRVARFPEGFRRVFDPRVAVPLAAGIAGLMLFATMSVDLGNDIADNPAIRDFASSGGTSGEQGLPTAVAGTAGTRNTGPTGGIERRIWDDKPPTLPGRAIAARQASAPGAAQFRVQPRLTSTERNLAIRLFRSDHGTGVGFYGRTDPDSQYLDLDAHIERAKSQPEVFLAAAGSTDEVDGRTFFAPFAARAAHRGDAKVVAGRLRHASHPQARSAAALFEQNWDRTPTRAAQPTYSR